MLVADKKSKFEAWEFFASPQNMSGAKNMQGTDFYNGKTFLSMNVKTINGLAGIMALITVAVTVLFAIIVDSFGRINTLVIAAVILLAALAVWGFSRHAMRKFIIYKIRPVYQVALSREVKTKELEKDLLHGASFEKKMKDELTEISENTRYEIARLKENEQYRKEYIGNVAHELKTPIFNIHGYISTLLDGAMEDKEISHKYLEFAEKNIDRLVNIVNDLDKITKLESGTLNMHMESFDIVELTTDIVDTIEFEATKRHIKIIIGDEDRIEQPKIMVMADKAYMEQVLVNLIINSIHYGKEGGTTHINFIDLFDKVMVEVSDNGIGISKEDCPRIFERFYRTDKSRSREQGGTGLGLAIVKHIIEAHNETITLRSELGVGSTFSFTLSKS